MGLSLRYLVAEDDRTVTRLARSQYQRWFSEGEALPANRVGRELRLLEAAVEMDHHRVVDVLRILPVRHWVRDDEKLDASAVMRLALKRFDILWRVSTGDAQARIEQLEALGTALLKRQPGPARLAELRAAVVRPGSAPSDG